MSIDKLSPREFEVIESMCAGNKSKETAILLRLSPRTVEVHRYNAFKKLGVHTSAEAAILFERAEVLKRINEKPVALAQYHRASGERELEWYRDGAGHLTESDRNDGWTEVLLVPITALAAKDGYISQLEAALAAKTERDHAVLEALEDCRDALVAARAFILKTEGTKNPAREEAIATANVILASTGDAA